MAKDLMATQTGGVDTSTSPDVSQQNTQTQDLSPKEKKESTEAADLGIPADVKPSASSFELPSSRQNFTDEAIKNAIPETKIEEPKQQDPANQQLIANSAPAKVLGIQPTEAPQNTTESTLDKELESKQDVPADVVTQEDEQNKSILKELGINANFSKNAYGSLSEDPTNLRIDLDSYSGVDYLPDTEEIDYDSEEIVSDFTRDENGFPIVDDNYDLAKSNLELKGRGVRLDNKGALIDVDETEDGEPKPDGFYSLGGRNYQKLDGNWLVKVNGKFVPLSSGDVERRKMTLESSAVMSKQPKKIIQETIEFAGIPIDAETRKRDANNIFQQKKSKEFSEQAIGDYTSKFQEGGEYSNIFKEAGIENPLPDGTYKYPGKQNVEYLKKDGAWYINNNPTGKGKGKDEFVPLTYGVKDRIISLERTARLKGTAEEETKASKQVKKNVEQALNTSFNEVSDVVSAYTQAGQSIYSFVKNLADKYNVSDEAFNIALKKAANGTLAESDEQVLQAFGSFYNNLEEIRLPVKTGGEFDLSRLFEYNMASPFEKYNLDGTLNPMFNESLFNEYNNTFEGKIGQLKQDAPLSVMNVGYQWDAIAKGSAAAKMNVQLGKIKAPGFYKAGNEVFRADGYGRWFDDDGNPVNDAGVIAALNSNGTENLTSNMKFLVNGSEVADIHPEQFPNVSKLIKEKTNIYKLIKSDEQLQAYLNSVLLDARENKFKLGADFESTSMAGIGMPLNARSILSGFYLNIPNVLNKETELNSLPIIEMLLDYDTTPEYWEKYQPEEGSLDIRNANMGVANSFINKAISEFYATKESELKARNFVSHNLNNLSAVLTADQLEGLKSYQNFMKVRLEEMDNNLTRSTEAFKEFKQKANEINNTISSEEMRALNSAPAKERKSIFKKIKKRQDNEVKALKEETLADVSASQFVSKDLSQTMMNAQTYVEEAKNINYYLKDLQNKGININQDLYQKKTEVLNQIPILGSTNSLNYGTSTEGEQLNTAMNLFKETRDMTDYMLTQVNDGNLIIQPDGSFDFALKGVTEEEIATIQATLDRYNQNINKYLSEKEVENKQERAEISSKIKNTNLDIANLSDRLRKSTSTSEISKLKKGIDELTNNKYNLERDLQQKREESSAVLLTDAPFLVGRVVSNAPVDLSKTILSAIPKDANLSPKNKFDLYFNGLVKELNKAKENANIDHSRLERASMKIRDLLDWNTVGLSLTKEEKEYLQLLTTVKQLMPLYMNNAASFSKESQGFFESFNQGMMNSFFPTTSKALGGSFMGADMRNEREAANVYMKVLNDIGLTEEDLNPTAVQEIAERGKETDLSDLEFWGQQTGLTSAIMYSFFVTRNVYKTGFDALKRTEKLLTGVTGLTKSEQVYMGISNTYDKLMDMNATTRFLKVPMAYGAQFEQAGQLVGAQEKELTFTAGLIGGVFAEGFAAAAKNFTPAQVKSYISGVFQENAPRVFKAIENASRVTGFGVGETAQELGEEMAHAWEESENGKNFYDVLEEKFGTFDKASKFFVSTFIMGAAFGLGTNSQRAKKAYDALPENMRQRVDQTIQMYQREMSAVQSAMDEYLSDNIENDVRSSVAEVITQEQTTTRDDKKDKQGVSGEVREGQESVQAEPVEGAIAQETGDGRVVQEKQDQVEGQTDVEFAGIPIGEQATPTEETQTLGEQTPVIESERVTLNNTTSPDNPFQISYSIDVDGSSVGEVTGRYDSKGNFIIDDISVSEGEQGKEIASETIDAISSETGGKVIISADSDNAARVGESFEKKGNATRNENGDFVVEPIQEATQEEETQQEPTEEKPLEEREPKSVADKLRRLKIKRTKGDGGITLYAGLPVDPMREGFKAAWNGAIETLATVIEKGGTAITNIKEALKQSKIRFQNSDFYQNLQTREEKAEQMSLFLEAVQNELQDKRIIEQEELTNKAIISAEKKFKESEWYKNLDLKGKRNAMKQFREAMRQEAESKAQKMSAEDRQKAKEFGERVNEVTGVTKPNPIQRIKERELIARSMKDRSRGAKDLRGLIKEATDYANTHLPKDEYSKREVSSLLKKIAKVKDVNSLDRVLGEVDALISKKEENFRKNSAKETQKRIQDIKRGKEITSKKGSRKVGSIDIEARKELDDFLKSINVDDMSNRSLEEIQAINDVIDGIIETGKADKSAVDRAKKTSERAERAKIMEGWRTSKDHKTNVNGISEIKEHLNQPGATVIVDGQLMGKSDFNEWLNRKKKEFKESKKPATTPTTPTTPTGPTMSPEEEQSLRSQLEEINGFISSSQERIDELERELVGSWINLDAKDIASINKEISYLRDAISNYQTEADKIQAQLDNAAKPQQEETKEDIFEETQMESFNRIKKMKKGSPEQQQAINEFNSKFGDTYERMSKIDSKFASIVSALESNKLIEKDC